MDIEQLKLAIAADPSAPVDFSGVSASDRAALEAFRKEMLSLNELIGKALAIDVPELHMPDLPALGEDTNVVNIPFGNKVSRRAPLWLGLAASAALVAVLGGQPLLNSTDSAALAAEVVAHLDHETGISAATSQAVSEQRLQAVVNTSGVDMESSLGLVTYAESCIINGKVVPHLVMQGEMGPITLLIMPDEAVDQVVPLSGESVKGFILPVGGGSIAIIGEQEENLEEVEQQVVDSVSFRV